MLKDRAHEIDMLLTTVAEAWLNAIGKGEVSIYEIKDFDGESSYTAVARWGGSYREGHFSIPWDWADADAEGRAKILADREAAEAAKEAAKKAKELAYIEKRERDELARLQAKWGST